MQQKIEAIEQKMELVKSNLAIMENYLFQLKAQCANAEMADAIDTLPDNTLSLQEMRKAINAKMNFNQDNWKKLYVAFDKMVGENTYTATQNYNTMLAKPISRIDYIFNVMDKGAILYNVAMQI